MAIAISKRLIALEMLLFFRDEIHRPTTERYKNPITIDRLP
jgi:hypothetical protein